MTGCEVLDGIKGEDVFLRSDAFDGMPWYGQLRVFLSIGVCKVPEDEVTDIQKALIGMGHKTHTMTRPGEPGVYVIGG